jgi:asparagine N-glycosylation enzyme membrane subunit Stt3
MPEIVAINWIFFIAGQAFGMFTVFAGYLIGRRLGKSH